MKKNILIINRHAPYGSIYANEQLQIAMVCAAYEQHVSLLFINDGIFALQRDQDVELLGVDKVLNTYKSLGKYYDIKNIYVDKKSMIERSYDKKSLVIPVEIINNKKIKQLLAKQDFIINN